MEETSLARQLRKLAAPQTSILKDSKIRASFLFDPREAAAVDNDTAFAIGVTGLEELVLLNEEFAEFERSLFSESSKFVERSVKTKAENVELDESIEEFLLLLSPYFLLRPAHKALEWLVYRFHVHQYNVDALLRCILPYHETRHFVRAVQLLDLSDKTSRWHWLEGLQKPGIPLSKTALVNQCTKDPGLLKFICNLLVSMVKAHEGSAVPLRPAVGFYTAAVLGTLETADKVTGKTVGLLLPFLLGGLASEMADHRAATYMIVAQLARRAVLQREFADELLVRVCKTLKAESLTCGVLCLLVVMSHQNIEVLPEPSIQALMKHKHRLVASLEELAGQHSVVPLLKALLAQRMALVLEAAEDGSGRRKMATLKELIQLALSLDGLAEFVIGCFFETYVNARVDGETGEVRKEAAFNEDAVLDVLKILRQRSPEQVDSCLERFLSSERDGACQMVQALMKTSVFGSEHALVGTTGEALFLALNNPSKRQRAMATEELVALIRQGKDLDRKFVVESLRNRLGDTEPEVVQATLKLGKELCTFVGHGRVLDVLERILFDTAERSKKWRSLRVQALQFACNDLQEFLDEAQILRVVLPHLAPGEDGEVPLAAVVLSSKLAQRFPLFKPLVANSKVKQALDRGDAAEFIDLALSQLGEAIQQVDDPISLIKSLEDACFSTSPAPQLRCICGNVVNALLAASSGDDSDQFHTALHFYQRLLAEKGDAVNAESMSAAIREGKVPLKTVCAGLKLILTKLPPVELLSESPAWSLKYEGSSAERIGLLSDLFKTVADQSTRKGGRRTAIRGLLRYFLNTHLPSLRHQMNFLSGLWNRHLTASTAPNSPDERAQSLALAVAVQLVQGSADEKQEKHDWMISEKSLVFLSMLLSLLSPTFEIRRLAVSLIEKALEVSPKTRSGLYSLASNIVDQSAEVATDSEQLVLLVAKWQQGLKKPNSLLALLNHSEVPTSLKLGILQLVAQVGTKESLESAVRAVSEVLDEDDRDVAPPLSAAKSDLVRACLSKYAEADQVGRLADVEGAVETLERALRCPRLCQGCEPVSTVALRVVSKELVLKLSKEKQSALLEILLDFAQEASEVQHAAVLKALRKVCSLGGLLVGPLQQTQTERRSTATTVREAKKMRLSEAPEESDPTQSASWRRILILLEVVQSRKSIDEVQLLVGPLYGLLKRSLELGSSPSAEYLRQCVLTSLRAHSLSAPRKELASLVKCLRVSQNAQTHQLVLSLLNLSAREFPDDVLHHVTSVFTFMGMNLLRQDDNYSFQVVMQTVETVVPALLQACGREATASDEAVASVTRVFVDAFGDIPEHRRLPLFAKLASTLGAADHLWILAAQMAGHHVEKAPLTAGAEDASSQSAAAHILDFGLALCTQFDVAIEVSTCTRLLQFAAGLPSSKDEPNLHPSHTEVFDVRRRTDKELQKFRLAVVTFVANLLGSPNFLGQVAELQRKGDGSAEPLYGDCLSTCLQSVQQTSRWTSVHSRSPCLRSWQTLLARLHDIVHKVNGLLPSGQFVSMVRSLMKHDLASIRRSAMEMLNAKLSAKRYFTPDDTAALLELIRPLCRVALGKGIQPEESSDGGPSAEDVALNRQTALLSLKLLIRMLGPDHHAEFAKVYDVVVELLGAEDLNSVLRSSALLCLAELCHSMPTATIVHFGRLIPLFLDVLQDRDRPELVTLAVVTALHRLVESLSPFLSAYLTVIIVEVCSLYANIVDGGTHAAAIRQRLDAVSAHLGQNVPLRVLVPTIEDSFASLDNTVAVGHLMTILNHLISSVEKSDLKGHLPQLQELVIKLLSYRMTHTELPAEDVDAVEDNVVGVVTSLSFKLSEVTFRPFFYRIFNWVTVPEDDRLKDRVLTFYHLTERLSETLKSLFVLFASVFTKHAADVLAETNSSKTEETFFEDESKCCQLLKHLLGTLTNCFKHGGQGFLIRERSAVFLKPLIDQLENVLGGEEVCRERAEETLVPCLAYFAAGCDDSSRKEWHQKLLCQMRHSSTKVRHVTLLAFREAVRKLGDDYLVLLPEAVPFLAELMEDESTEVEQLCQEVILEVEQILGEPLMKYF
ncbi:HEAT repeat-containing protein 1 [Ixodes scapularis]|uniref:HEAT repeat-containing protein 1 n=1 Tax=Ixodes scapularis TaxID=6945 RepID=UPI001A9DF385|nr:HEAT repeat-containing protein 1 [Ixodes scapularis]